MSVAPAPSLSLEECSFSLNCKSDRSFPHVNKHITIKAHHPRYGRVGVLYACRIDKSTCSVRGDFHLIMDESELSELSEFAFWLFDKRGQLKPEFTANEYQRGTGAFGQELNDAILLYVPSVIVEPEVIRNSLCVVVQADQSILVNSSEGAVWLLAFSGSSRAPHMVRRRSASSPIPPRSRDLKGRNWPPRPEQL